MAAQPVPTPKGPLALASYTPTTAAAIQRSQLLARALQQMQEGGQKITGGWGELGARLLADAIMQRSSTKADADVIAASRNDQNAQIASAVSGLGMDPAPYLTPAPAAPAPASNTGGLVGAIRGLFGGSKPASAMASAPPPPANENGGQPFSLQSTGPSGDATVSPADASAGHTKGGLQIGPGYGQAASPHVVAQSPTSPGLSTAAPSPSASMLPAAVPPQADPSAQGPTPNASPAPAPMMVAASSPAPGAGPPDAPQPAMAAIQTSPQDRDAMIRMVATEAGGEGPVGMAAAAHVAINRLNAGYGGAKSLHDVVYQPHQFEGITRGHMPDQQTMAGAARVVDAVLSGQVADPTGGAQAFLNPALQTQLGRSIPKWAQGPGLQIGRHTFFGGNASQQPQFAGQGAPPPPTSPDPNGPPVQNVAAYQIASNGPTPPPPGMNGPQSALPPQAQQPQPQPQAMPPMQLNDQQKAYLTQHLMSADPAMRAAGLAYADQLQKDFASRKYEFSFQNGHPTWADPYRPGAMTVGDLPDQLRYHQEAGPTPFTVKQIGPDGKTDYQAIPNGMGPIPSGSAYQNGQLVRVPTQQQKPFRIDGAPGLYVTGADGNPTKVADDQYGPSELLKMRQDLLGSQPVQNYQQSADAYGAMINSAKQNPGGMRAYALRDTFARAINPGAVARTTTIEAIKQAQGVPAEVRAFFDNLKGDGDVPPQIAQQILDITQGFVASHYRGAHDLVQSNADYAKRHHFDPADAIVPLGPPPQRYVIGSDRPAAPVQAAPGTMDAALGEAVRRGIPLTPQQQQRAHQLGLIR